ncbi:MAG: calcium-binding protein [Pseudomonadota bacterium]
MTSQFKKLALGTGLLFSAVALCLPAFAADATVGTGGYARQLQKLEMMKMLDADGNHMVSTAEADSYYSSIFDALNKDTDDSLDAKEWAGPSKNSKLDLTTGGYANELRSIKMMRLMDADSDHLVTRAEFLAYNKNVFGLQDKSGDGQIDAQEWVAKIVGGK